MTTRRRCLTAPRLAAPRLAPLLLVALLALPGCAATRPVDAGVRPSGAEPRPAEAPQGYAQAGQEDRAEAEQDPTEIRGEVERVVTYADEIDVWTADRRIVSVHYDGATEVLYRGETLEPRNLEPGDVVRIDVDRGKGGKWLARHIDVEQGRQDRAGATAEGPAEGPTLAGEVQKVDAAERVVELTDDDGTTHRVHFRVGTVVYYQGDRYQVGNLEPGDEVSAEVERDLQGDWTTDTITVIRSRQDRGIGDDGDGTPPPRGERPPRRRDGPPGRRPPDDDGDGDGFTPGAPAQQVRAP